MLAAVVPRAGPPAGGGGVVLAHGMMQTLAAWPRMSPMRMNERRSCTQGTEPAPRPYGRGLLRRQWLRAALGAALASAAGGCGMGVLDASSYLTWARPAPP